MWGDSPYYSGGGIEFTSATITTTSTTGAVDKTRTFLAAELLALLPVAPYCKDKKPIRCKAKKCNKRKMFKKNCQATCAAHCLEDPENKKCPKDKENKKCNPLEGKVDCTSKKTRKKCPLSCPVCVLAETNP